MPVTAALALPNGKAYLFHGKTYSRFDNRSGQLEGAGVQISAHWRNVPEDAPGAAVYWGYGKAYFFYGNEYIRYDLPRDEVDPEYLPPNTRPETARHWGGLPAPLDSVVNWGNGKLYGFSGKDYYRYDITLERVDPGYPLPIGGNWPGIWPEGIDDVLYQGGKYAYFFKGEKYVRYDVYADTSDSEQSLISLTLDPVPAGMLTAARDLTLPAARDVMGYLIDHGKLSLDAAKTPYSGPWNTITTPKEGARIVIKPPALDGISYEYVGGPTSMIDNVDQRMAVVLYRLGRWLNSSELTVEKITHLGIGHGGGPPSDCHNQGRAIDFAGVIGTHAGNSFKKSILADWGNRPIAGVGLRLDSATDDIAYRQFLTAFRFGTFECECNGIGGQNKWPPKSIGETGGYVIHPDYVDPPTSTQKLRSSHQDHIHMQIGPTRI